MTAGTSSADLISMLGETWSATADLCALLTAEQWRATTECPGWDVQAQVSHLIGTEAMLAGEPTPAFDGPYPAHAANDIAKFNEHWIAHLAALSDTELLDRFRAVTDARLTALTALSAEEWEADGPTPVGVAPYRRFMEIRVFDSFAHEQDIRVAIGQPGHAAGPAAERSIDEIVGALGFLMGKKAKLADGATVRFVVGDRTVDVVVDGRARVVDHAERAPDATVTTDPVTFLRLAGGRISGATAKAGGLVTVAGDPALGERIAASLAFTM